MQIKYTNKYGQEVVISDKPSSLRLYDLEGKCGVLNEISSSKNTYMDGVNVNATTVNERELILTGKIISSNKSEVESIRRKLLSTFTPKGKGKLYFKENENSKEYLIETIVSSAPVFLSVDFNVTEFVIELIAPDPYWRDTYEGKVNIANIQGKFSFPLNLPTLMGTKKPNLIVNCANNGDVPTGLRIEFTALSQVVNPSLFNINTREYIKVNITLNSGDKIVINTNQGRKSVVVIANNIETKILHLLDFNSTFLQVEKGDNLFRYDAEVGIERLTCNLYYSPKYLGV